MASTTTRPLAEPPAGPPPITAAVREMLARERQRMQANPDPRPAPADLTTETAFLFRAQPGTHRVIAHTLPMPPEESAYGDEKRYHFTLRRWKATVAAKRYPELPREEAAAKLAAELEALRDEIGDTTFKFTRVTRRQECYLATNSERLAVYVRGLMAEGVGEFANVYEVNQRARIVVGDQVFPNTETGKRLALAYAEQAGVTEIAFVKE